MGSLYLNRLSSEEHQNLKERLHATQKGKCFICELPIDLRIHEGQLDIDHVNPTSLGGKDEPSNFALTHSSCNRSKQDSNLDVARILRKFETLKESLSVENRGPNLDDVLQANLGSQHSLKLVRDGEKLRFSFSEIGKNEINETLIFKDKLSGFEYSFMVLPIEYVYHDDKINPRSIGSNISKLIKEFYLKRPQLHVSLGWVRLDGHETVKVRMFDGQHKAAAQILLGARYLPVRVFINPDKDLLLTTNTNAGTKLRQIAFDKSVQRHLGSQLYLDRIRKYQNETNKNEDDFGFSEKDLQSFFKGESREIKRYILDAVRDAITYSPENRLKDFIDFGGRSTERPLSYSTIDKTFYSFFIYQGVLDTPLDFMMEGGENPRDLEKDQIIRLMSIIADEIYIGKFDHDIGTRQIENRIKKGEELPSDHIRAFRMSREEILYNWLRYIEQIIKHSFIVLGKPIDENRLFQYKFPETVWERIRVFLKNLAEMPVWVNTQLSTTVFGGKQTNDFWRKIFETGKSPQGIQVLPEPINLLEMMKE